MTVSFEEISMEVTEAHPKDDLDSWMYFYDRDGNEVGRFKGFDINISNVRSGLRAAKDLFDVGYMGLVHGRDLPQHQARVTWIELATQETKGFVIRGGQVSPATISKKDVVLLERIQVMRGGADNEAS